MWAERGLGEHVAEPSLTTDGLMHKGGAIREIAISMIVCQKAPGLFSGRKSIEGGMVDEIKDYASVRDRYENAGSCKSYEA